MSKLLIDERPMMVLPSLAARIGLDEAVVLQQIHYWLDIHEAAAGDRTFKDNRYWVYNTIEDWQKQFRWCATDKINRILLFLERSGLVETDKPDKKKWNQRKWYTINYEAVAALETMEEGAWKLGIDKRAIAIAEYLENAGIPTKQHCRNLRQSEQATCGDHLYTEITSENTFNLTKGSERPRANSSSFSCGTTKSGSVNRELRFLEKDNPIRSAKSSDGGTNQERPPSPVSAAPPSPAKVASIRRDENGLLRFPDSGADKLAGRLALRSTQVWLCATALEFKFSVRNGQYYAKDPFSGIWEAERDMFDHEMPMGKIMSLLDNYKDCSVTNEEINQEMQEWFDHWKGFIKGKTLKKGQYYSVIPSVLKTYDIELSEMGED